MQGMGDGVLIHVRKGDYAILETKEGYIISVLFPNAYRNSHFDVSRDFKLDISGLIQSGDFEALDALSQDIRRCYASFQRYETENVNVTGRRLMSKLKLAIKPWDFTLYRCGNDTHVLKVIFSEGDYKVDVERFFIVTDSLLNAEDLFSACERVSANIRMSCEGFANSEISKRDFDLL
ncbi:hypothetical protein [Pantoea agglomerans]|uniref:hypothetical protein n=1 Tax=Enterobacter agglomerans TaxID=549 RepID=UPI00165465D3|nr:hypothetical protein [Pantoea agglomerans]